MEHMAILVRRF